MNILTEQEIKNELLNVPNWVLINNYIQREFCISNFVEAVSFVLKVAFIAEKLDHHPDINIHSWNKVKITTSTHEVNTLTKKDFELAKQINSISFSN